MIFGLVKVGNLEFLEGRDNSGGGDQDSFRCFAGLLSSASSKWISGICIALEYLLG